MRKVLEAIRDGAIGVELCLWCGFGIDRGEGGHRFIRLGVVTLYGSRWRLDRFLAMWRAAKERFTRLAGG